jgi:dTDP-4-amino-4,6-dideoxygalactose transaminase
MAIAAEQIKRLDQFNSAREENFGRLRRALRRDVPFINWPRLSKGSRRGYYGTPGLYDYDRNTVSRDLFVEACAAEGLRLGTGYANWYRASLFQDMDLYGQLWPVRHENGVAFRPVPPGGLPNDEELRTRLMVFPIPATETPDLIDQMAAAARKVADNMDALADRQRKERED